MHVLFAFILFAIVEGKRSSHNLPIPRNQEISVRIPEQSQQDFDFGHVYRNGFRGPNQKFDVQDDTVQADIDNIKDVKQKPRKSMNLENVRQPLFLSPRDEVLYHKKYNKSFTQTQHEKKKNNGDNTDAITKSVTRPLWIDFSRILERNIASPNANRRRKIFGTKNDGKIKQVENKVKAVNLSSYFENNTFLKKSKSKLNWTTCSEFAKRAVFHPDDVVNTAWLPFYIWSTRDFSSSIIHTFSYPTKKVI